MDLAYSLLTDESGIRAPEYNGDLSARADEDTSGIRADYNGDLGPRAEKDTSGVRADYHRDLSSRADKSRAEKTKPLAPQQSTVTGGVRPADYTGDLSSPAKEAEPFVAPDDDDGLTLEQFAERFFFKRMLEI